MTKSFRVVNDWPPYDPVTDTNDGWYTYSLRQTEMRLEREDSEETLFPVPRVAWRADTDFLNDFYHVMEKQYTSTELGAKNVRHLIYRRMLDCIRRDHQPWDGPKPTWHSTTRSSRPSCGRLSSSGVDPRRRSVHPTSKMVQ